MKTKIKNLFNNNIFIFLWINLSFFVWLYQNYQAFQINQTFQIPQNGTQILQNELSNQAQIENILKYGIFALSYFPFVNFIYLMIYKLKSSNFICLISIFYIFYFDVFKVLKISFFDIKSSLNIILSLIYGIIWIVFIISTIIFIYKKPLK